MIEGMALNWISVVLTNPSRDRLFFRASEMGYFANFMACQYLSFSSNPAQQGWSILTSDRIPVYSEIIRQAKKHAGKAMTNTGLLSQSIFTHRLSLAHSGSRPIFPARIQNNGAQT